MQVELLSSIEENALLNIKNIELISYFNKSTIKTPVFLSTIQKRYSEIKALLENGFIKASKPVKSYFFNINKLEDFFYETYQEKIDLLKEYITLNKQEQERIVQSVEEMEPNSGSEDYDTRLKECVLYAKNCLEDIKQLKIQKKEFKKVIYDLRDGMVRDPFYKFILFVRNDKEFVFNKRTEDHDGRIKKILLHYANSCTNGNGQKLLSLLKNQNFYKEYSPAMNYYITELGKQVDLELKKFRWEESEYEQYEKTAEELLQEEELEKLREFIGF
ncbi:MAG: hypothetical protein JW891_13865 [Candidatus Lokiarchaeota archaeon]|nr:hypothetical protein [Candidatus Lokiarchaeota archaeon]